MNETPSLCISPLKSATLLSFVESHHLRVILKSCKRHAAFHSVALSLRPLWETPALFSVGVTSLQCRLNRQHRSLLIFYWAYGV